MASISKGPNGHRMLQFTAVDNKRKTIRLGKMSQRLAESFKHRVEQLISAKRSGAAMDADTASWVGSLPPKMAEKLVRVDLIASRQLPSKSSLRTFLDDYVNSRIDVKPATKEVWRQIVENMCEFFGDDRKLPGINEGDAEDFKMYLHGKGLASTTIHKRLQFARMFFKAAKKRKLIESNPFADVMTRAVTPENRQYFVTREETERLLQVADPIWTLIITLARYGGLRCPSEVLSLRWEHVNWDTNRITVPSPKTAHHPGKAQRVIPIFKELQPYLSEAFDQAPEGTEFVVGGQYREAAETNKGWRNCNLRTQLLRLIKRAGLESWPKTFHAFRASRETELAREHPLHVVTKWLGNTPRIAMKHYLQVTNEDFSKAAGNTVASAAQSAAKSAAAPACTLAHPTPETTKAPASARAYATGCSTMLHGANTPSGEDRIRTCGPVTRTRI